MLVTRTGKVRLRTSITGTFRLPRPLNMKLKIVFNTFHRIKNELPCSHMLKLEKGICNLHFLQGEWVEMR